MDGLTLLTRLQNELQESDSSAFLDDRYSYELLWEAAQEFVFQTKCLTASTTLTTVADQTNYTLPADFLELFLRNSDGEYFVQYDDGSDTSNLTYREYEEIIYANNTTSVSIPSRFCIIDKASLPSQITGTASADGNKSGGQCTLTVASDTFTSGLVAPGDIVHNVTDGSSGVVLSVTDAKNLVCALFNGTDNEWDNGDSFVIQPQARDQLMLDPPPSTSSHTITVYYIQRPDPVFSDYGIYRIPEKYHQALVFYAAFLYFDRDREERHSNRFFQLWGNVVRQAKHEIGRRYKRNRKLTIRFKA